MHVVMTYDSLKNIAEVNRKVTTVNLAWPSWFVVWTQPRNSTT